MTKLAIRLLLAYGKDQLSDLAAYLLFCLRLCGIPRDATQAAQWVRAGLEWVLRHGTPTLEDVRAQLDA